MIFLDKIYTYMAILGTILLFSGYLALSFDKISILTYYKYNLVASYLIAHSAYGRKIWDLFLINVVWCAISFINII